MTTSPAPAEGDTMTVRIRVRAAEGAWGSGPAIRSVTIARACPRCGGRRGEPRNLDQCAAAAWYPVDVWTNPCGHVDSYAAVATEAASIAALTGQETGRG